MHKTRLQDFTSKSGIQFPVYHTINEGQDHIPKFRSTVWVAEMHYTSPSTFSQKKKKAAEQDVARLALEGILHRTRDEGLFLVDQISPIFKSIMNEYAHKLHVEQPTYNNDKQLLGGVLPAFITSLVFNGTSYTGGPAGTKKDVEQSAAKAAILSIMGILPCDSSSGTSLAEIIRATGAVYPSRR
ncbi:Double-stranded RNA-binding protein 4 [Glycine soja]